jgi:hypothetical protein
VAEDGSPEFKPQYHKKKKKAGHVTQAVEYLPSKHEALSANPTPIQTNNNKYAK